VLPALLVMGFGLGPAIATGMSSATLGVRAEDAGVASAMVNTRSRSYGAVVDNVKVNVREYVPVRSGSVAPMCCRNVTVTGSLETGAAHADFENSTRSGSLSERAPFARDPESTLSAASPALEITLADVDVTYSCSTPGAN
jgi:hypothetical protein